MTFILGVIVGELTFIGALFFIHAATGSDDK